MDTSGSSIFRLLQEISDVTRCRSESETDYENLLRKIFKKGTEAPSEYGDLLGKNFKKGGLPIPKTENVFGRKQEMTKLLLKCCNPDQEAGIQLSTIPILGAAGIGKTALARLIYEHISTVNHFEMRVWVRADGAEFTPDRAGQEILKSAMGMLCSTDDPDELDEMVRDTFLGRRCLIVLDGVESMTLDLWLHMKNIWFSSVDVGSIVLITTPSEAVAKLVSNGVFELKRLLPDDAWSLYRYHSLTSEDSSRILEALCGYNPLLLKLVGSMMSYQTDLLSNVHFTNVINSLPTFDASFAILLCVWALPPQIRQCLAFCAVFPKGCTLEREKIINMWAAHGLLKPSPKNSRHDIGNFYFHQLLCRSFFTDIARNEYGDITEFRIPGLIHRIMQDVASIVWKGKVGVIGSVSEDAHHLSVNLEETEDLRLLSFSSTLYSGARSLECSFNHFRELESLDLSCSGIRNLSDDIYALAELRYINLSYTLIETLPDSFTELLKLQTLDLSCCYHFKVFPSSIYHMKFLSHLDLSQCESLSYMSYGIGFLTSLTSLPLFVLGKNPSSAGLEELGRLNQLSGRLDIKNLENIREIGEARKAQLNKKIKLEHLGLCWSKDVDLDDCFQVLNFLEPNGQLKVVYIEGYAGFKFPGWISSMSSLIKISITDSGCKELPSLGQLRRLKELHLKGMPNIHYIGPEFYGGRFISAFPSLELLGLYDMPNLLNWLGAMGSGKAFRSLKTLSIEGCPRLLNIPTFRNHLDLILCSSSDEILSPLEQTRFGSPSSLLIKNMELRNIFHNSIEWQSLKKLILFNCTHYMDIPHLLIDVKSLEYLGISRCPQVRGIQLMFAYSIQKLHCVDCPNLDLIYIRQEATKLTELVVDGCPKLYFSYPISVLGSVTKLIIRGNDKCLRARDFKKLKKLRYLSISECPWLERGLEMDPSLVSHIPCVLLPDHKAEYQDSKDSEDIWQNKESLENRNVKYKDSKDSEDHWQKELEEELEMEHQF